MSNFYAHIKRNFHLIKAFLSITLLLMMFNTKSFSQTENCEFIEFAYDNLGNRIQRELVVEPCDTQGGGGGNATRYGREDAESDETSRELSTIKVYPNPADNVLYIDTGRDRLISEYFLFDVQGKLLLSENPNSNLSKLDFENLASGIYILTVLSDSKEQSFKITKR